MICGKERKGGRGKMWEGGRKGKENWEEREKKFGIELIERWEMKEKWQVRGKKEEGGGKKGRS